MAPCALAVLLAACHARETPAPLVGGPAAEGRRLLEAGQLDAAAAKLGEAGGDDADALYDLGRVWARKAEQAPLPTPPPAPNPVPRGWEPPRPPEFKSEELRAVGFFEKALATRPDHGPAHFALAQLLAPHALRQHDRLAEAPRARGRKGAKPAPPVIPDTGGVDITTERVVRSYDVAVRAEPRIEGALEACVSFAERVGDVDATDRAYQEVIRRAGPRSESAGPIVRYGDFLRSVRKDTNAAVEQYRQALIWRPDDDATRGKLADIYIALGVELYARQQYASAAARFTEAARYLTDQSSAQAATVRDYQSRLAAIRR
jgi:tetratricopeptide (TPR) repeat protein